MTLKQFIMENQAAIDKVIQQTPSGPVIDNAERRLWILNDEGLYNWAKEAGVDL